MNTNSNKIKQMNNEMVLKVIPNYDNDIKILTEVYNQSESNDETRKQLHEIALEVKQIKNDVRKILTILTKLTRNDVVEEKIDMLTEKMNNYETYMIKMYPTVLASTRLISKKK